MSLADAQQRVDAWVGRYEEGYFHPLTNLVRLTEEVGELAREVNHRFGQKTKKRDEAEGDLAMEMADILFVLICMANREGIDLQAAFDRMMAKVETRDRDRWTKKGGQAGGRADRRSGGRADRRSGGQADRRRVGRWTGGRSTRQTVGPTIGSRLFRSSAAQQCH